MINEKKRFRGFKSKRCPECYISQIACICGNTPVIETKAAFCLLFHEYEINKPTNTGRLILRGIPGSKYFIWKRTEPDIELLNIINNPLYQPYIVFPIEKEEPVYSKNQSFVDDNKKPFFIILDGTWNQARKIYRKSPYLAKLPAIFLNTKKNSEYTLRSGTEPGQLCTVEVAIELLKLSNENEASLKLYEYFKDFSKHYYAGKHQKPVYNL